MNLMNTKHKKWLKRLSYCIYQSHDEIVAAAIIFNEEIISNNTIQCDRYIIVMYLLVSPLQNTDLYITIMYSM